MAEKRGPGESINNNITRVNCDFVSMYVYRRGSSAMCIDAGLNQKKVKEGFADCGLKPGDIDAVFLTHADRDHTGGIKVFTGAKVFMSFEEGEMIHRGTARFFRSIHNREPECTLNYLRDNDEIAIGDLHVKCLSTPGHTLGSMSFLVDEKYLFVGDILNLKKGKAVMDRGFLQMDKALQKESIKRLSRLNNIEILLTAHTGFTHDFGKPMNGWRQGQI